MYGPASRKARGDALASLSVASVGHGRLAAWGVAAVAAEEAPARRLLTPCEDADWRRLFSKGFSLGASCRLALEEALAVSCLRLPLAFIESLSSAAAIMPIALAALVDIAAAGAA